ncbi:hypothetical protein BH23PLA1_BH23PLA1_33350 [soil metagenome]
MLGLDEKTWNLLGAMALVAVVMGLALIGGKLIAHIRRQIREEQELTSLSDLLEPLRESYEAGEIDEAEFRRIQETLARGKHIPKKPTLPGDPFRKEQW